MTFTRVNSRISAFFIPRYQYRLYLLLLLLLLLLLQIEPPAPFSSQSFLQEYTIKASSFIYSPLKKKRNE